MTYNATYTSDDVAPVIVDGGTKIVVGISTFATVLGLIAGVGFGMGIFKWATKK